MQCRTCRVGIRCCEKLESSVELEKLDSLNELILTNMPQDFVEDIRTRMQDRGILLTNKWEFSTSHVSFLRLYSLCSVFFVGYEEGSRTKIKYLIFFKGYLINYNL